MTPYLYVPIIKGKQNDCRALTDLSADSRAVTKPLLDLLPLEMGKSIDNHLAAFIKRVAHVAGCGPIFVDMYGPRPGETTALGQLAVIAGFSSIVKQNLPVTPVFGFQRDDAVWPGLATIVAQLNSGFCFRIDWDDLDDQAEDTWSEILERTVKLGLDPVHIDLLLDLRSLQDKNVPRLESAGVDFLSLRPLDYQPRTIIVAGSSALKDVTPVPSNGTGAVPREELRLWARLSADLAESTGLVYADYGIVHPEFTPAIRSSTANAKIRYSTSTAIHYFRGTSLYKSSGPGFAQYHSLATRVLNSGLFRGSDFSVGDRFIADCGAGTTGPGNLPTWVRVDQNHHFELAARQMAMLAPQVKVAASAKAAELLIAE